MTLYKKSSLSPFFILPFIFLLSCEEKDHKPNPDCSLVKCIDAHFSIKIKFIDEITNKDLLFVTGANYTIKDIKIFPATSPPEYLPFVRIDSTNGKVLTFEYLKTGDSIKLGDLPADIITYSTKKPSDKICCPSLEVTKLSVNNVLICQPCTDLDQSIIILKK